MTAPSRCQYQDSCKLLSPDRKVTSHYFGRNKKETRAIPESCWVLYCRQHYQRCRYRSSDAAFAAIQMDLVRRTVYNLEQSKQVKSFTIALRKRAMDRLNVEDRMNKENLDAKNRGVPPPHGPTDKIESCRERWLVRFCGANQSFANVYELIDAVVHFCEHQNCNALEFEVVPNFVDSLPPSAKNKPTVKRTATNKSGAASRVTKIARTAKTISPRQITRSKS